MTDIKNQILKYLNIAKEKLHTDRRCQVGAIGFLVVLLIYGFGRSSEPNRAIMYEAKSVDFKKGRLLGTQTYDFVKDKERSLSKMFNRYKQDQSRLLARLEKLERSKPPTIELPKK